MMNLIKILGEKLLGKLTIIMVFRTNVISWTIGAIVSYYSETAAKKLLS